MLPLLLALACAGPEPASPPAAPTARALTGGASSAPAVATSADSPVLARARAAVPDAVAAAEQAGARVIPADRGAFTLAWEPPTPAERTLVSLHGHAGWAHEDLRVWLPHARKHGFRLLAVQWWVGTRDETPDYLDPDALYRTIDDALRQVGARPGAVLLHGFSRGATLTYALAAMDPRHGRWFGAVVANAGGAHLDFPPTAQVDRGRYGPRPYAGQDWVLFCGGRDPDPKLNGCPAMRTTERWIEEKGATATLLADEAADHGGFHRNPDNVRRALEAWRR